MDAGCGALGAGATDVYVDQRFTGASQTGTQACPFATILAGTTAAAPLSGSVTIHVAGATPPLTYAESGSVTVSANRVLQGQGATMVTISASGSCASGTCAVTVEGGGAIDGFTVVSSGGDGVDTAAASPAPVVSNVSASGSHGWGIVAAGAVNLGPNIVVNGNGSGGVESPADASGVVHVITGTNSFDNNHGNGLNFDGSSVLHFEGGTANGNFQGIRLAGAGAGPHTITSLVATNNSGPGGIVAYNGQSIVLRSSALVGNANVGLLYDYVGSSTLDIGGNTPGE